jgi:hypothetical protein
VRLSKETLLYFLEIDGRSFDEPIKYIWLAEKFFVGQNTMDEDSYEKLDDFSRKLYLIGNMAVLTRLAFPAFFNKKFDNDMNVVRVLKDGVRAKIEERLKVIAADNIE